MIRAVIVFTVPACSVFAHTHTSHTNTLAPTEICFSYKLHVQPEPHAWQTFRYIIQLILLLFFLFRLQHWFFFCFLLYLAIRDKAPFFSSHSPVQGANPRDHRMLVFFMHQWKKHNVAGATRVVCGSCEHVGCVIAASHPRQDTTPSSPVASIYICIRDSGF